MRRHFIVAATVMTAAISMSPAADQERGPEPVGPIVARLIEGPGTFEPRSLDLRPGEYIFMVTNQGVDHPVDFVLRLTKTDRAGDDPSERPIRGSRLSRRIGNGETASSSVVEMKPGTYTYSSALNPTPEFTISVR